jgi:uncharacterized lipoprotein YajG
MRKHTGMLAAATLLLAACSAGSTTEPAVRIHAPSPIASFSAAASDHSELPVPGSPGCRGQTEAYVAQFGKNNDVEGLHGVGGYAKLAGVSVQELQAAITAYCTTP